MAKHYLCISIRCIKCFLMSKHYLYLCISISCIKYFLKAKQSLCISISCIKGFLMVKHYVVHISKSCFHFIFELILRAIENLDCLILCLRHGHTHSTALVSLPTPSFLETSVLAKNCIYSQFKIARKNL